MQVCKHLNSVLIWIPEFCNHRNGSFTQKENPMNHKHTHPKTIRFFLTAFLAFAIMLQPVGKGANPPDECGISLCNKDTGEVNLPEDSTPPKPH